MKRQTVVIKSNRYGIMLFLDKDIPFEELLADIAEKFKTSSDFFKDARMTLAFEGRSINHEQQMDIIRVIQENPSTYWVAGTANGDTYLIIKIGDCICPGISL